MTGGARRGPEILGPGRRDPQAPPARRDYEALRRRWRALEGAGLRCVEEACIAGYDIDRLELTGSRPAARRLLLAAGTHGDEPAGPEALVAFLASGLDDLRGRLDLVVLPCINPWGYVHDCRANAEGVDINRAFEDDGAPEAALVKRLLHDQVFDLFLEFHEDWEFEGYYLFECRRHGPGLGSRIVTRVRSLGPIYDRPEIDDVPVVDGVATATPDVIEGQRDRIGLKPLPLWLFGTGRTARSITSETPSTHWDLDRRVAAHRAALRVCLDHLLEQARR